jgi:mannose/cellobiose epimerase-like protein (N-acyl-D-glucosamine 2-epimerase family)
MSRTAAAPAPMDGAGRRGYAAGMISAAAEPTFADLDSAWAWARSWLFDTALPLWSSRGVDPRGGFVDQLTEDYQPTSVPQRLRVQGRQIYVFAEAGRIGWDGPWRQMVDHGLAFLQGPMREPGGLIWAKVADGAGYGVQLYDHAFGLLALAHGLRATGEAALEVRAKEVWAAMRVRLGRPGGGFLETDAGEAPLQSNPHMHLYEALIAWMRVSPDPFWRAAADEIVALADEVFIDRESGRLCEFFAADGARAPGPAGEVVEPGHQFEWGWLFVADSRLQAARALALPAFDNGIDRARNLTVNAQDRTGRWTDAGARLWCQTERMQAALAFRGRDASRDWDREALLALDAIRQYIAPLPPGLFYDMQRADGTFVVEPIKASSLYHVMGALVALRDAVER